MFSTPVHPNGFYNSFFAKKNRLPVLQQIALSALALGTFYLAAHHKTTFFALAVLTAGYSIFSCYAIHRLLGCMAPPLLFFKTDLIATFFLSTLTLLGGMFLGCGAFLLKSKVSSLITAEKSVKNPLPFLKEISFLFFSTGFLISAGIDLSSSSHKWTVWFNEKRETLLSSLSTSRVEFSTLLKQQLEQDSSLPWPTITHPYVLQRLGLPSVLHLDIAVLGDYSPEDIIVCLNTPTLTYDQFKAILDAHLPKIGFSFLYNPLGYVRTNSPAYAKFSSYLEAKAIHNELDAFFDTHIEAIPLCLTLKANHPARQRIEPYLTLRLQPPSLPHLVEQELNNFENDVSSFEQKSDLNKIQDIKEQIKFIQEEIDKAKSYETFLNKYISILQESDRESYKNQATSISEQLANFVKNFIPLRDKFFDLCRSRGVNLPASQIPADNEMFDDPATYLSTLGIRADQCKELTRQHTDECWVHLNTALGKHGITDKKTLLQILKEKKLLLSTYEDEKPNQDQLWQAVIQLLCPPSTPFQIKLKTSLHKNLYKTACLAHSLFQNLLTLGLLGLQFYHKPQPMGLGMVVGFWKNIPNRYSYLTDFFFLSPSLQHPLPSFSQFSRSIFFRTTFTIQIISGNNVNDIFFQMGAGIGAASYLSRPLSNLIQKIYNYTRAYVRST